MFSKAKRFDGTAKNQAKEEKKPEIEVPKAKTNVTSTPTVSVKSRPATSNTLKNFDIQSQSSSARSTKSFVTPKPVKPIPLVRAPSSLKKVLPSTYKNAEQKTATNNKKISDDIIKSQEVEIRNKDYTISEYSRQIDDLKIEIANLQKQLNETLKEHNNDLENINTKISEIHIAEAKNADGLDIEQNCNMINELKMQISTLEHQCDKLEQEVSSKQVELSSLEEVICIRDSLCKDLQDKLTNVETCLDETRQRLEMVKGHHALALEANESIRREYKVELETMKVKLEEEKQSITNKFKTDQECIKSKYNAMIESIKTHLIKEKDYTVNELQQQIVSKDNEMKAKLEQIDEATHEKLRLCEIQFEERCRSIQEHWIMQEEKIQYLEKETNDLKYSLGAAEEQKMKLQKEINILRNQKETLETEKSDLEREVNDLKDESKRKFIDFENQINKLTVEVDKAVKEKVKFEMSLSVTRDIVHVLTMRLRESDDEVEHLEGKVQVLKEDKDGLQEELTKYKKSLNNTLLECSEYKEALVNILKSKAALAKEHTRIMEHNVSLIESLQNVEKEAYRELGTIKNELIEDVEILKKESSSQIQMLREEVEEKRVLCDIAKEHAGQATAAAEQSRALLSHAANEIGRLETDNKRLTSQIDDQQSLVVELSLLRQENEELAMTVAKQSSILDKMKKDQLIMDQKQSKPTSPLVSRKTHMLGKENAPIIISPLRERNH